MTANGEKRFKIAATIVGWAVILVAVVFGYGQNSAQITTNTNSIVDHEVRIRSNERSIDQRFGVIETELKNIKQLLHDARERGD